MSYQSGDKLKNRYLSNDAFTSLKNKLGGRSITSLGNNRRRNSYKIANQGFDLLDYKTLIYKTFIILLLLLICIYIIPQTRYMMHGIVSNRFNKVDDDKINNDLSDQVVGSDVYNVAPVFSKTDEFIAKQSYDILINNGTYVYDLITRNPIGVALDNSSSTLNIKLFSDSGFKNNFLIEQSDVTNTPITVDKNTESTSSTTSTSSESVSTSTDIKPDIVKAADKFYQSYVFEGLGYGQLIAKVPPGINIKTDSLLYIRTIDGLKSIAKIVNIDKDNKSTFTIIHAQLIVSPQNIYKVIIKN